MFGCCDERYEEIEKLNIRIKDLFNRNCEYHEVLSYFTDEGYIQDQDITDEVVSKHREMMNRARALCTK